MIRSTSSLHESYISLPLVSKLCSSSSLHFTPRRSIHSPTSAFPSPSFSSSSSLHSSSTHSPLSFRSFHSCSSLPSNLYVTPRSRPSIPIRSFASSASASASSTTVDTGTEAEMIQIKAFFTGLGLPEYANLFTSWQHLMTCKSFELKRLSIVSVKHRKKILQACELYKQRLRVEKMEQYIRENGKTKTPEELQLALYAIQYGHIYTAIEARAENEEIESEWRKAIALEWQRRKAYNLLVTGAAYPTMGHEWQRYKSQSERLHKLRGMKHWIANEQSKHYSFNNKEDLVPVTKIRNEGDPEEVVEDLSAPQPRTPEDMKRLKELAEAYEEEKQVDDSMELTEEGQRRAERLAEKYLEIEERRKRIGEVSDLEEDLALIEMREAEGIKEWEDWRFDSQDADTIETIVGETEKEDDEDEDGENAANQTNAKGKENSTPQANETQSPAAASSSSLSSSNSESSFNRLDDQSASILSLTARDLMGDREGSEEENEEDEEMEMENESENEPEQSEEELKDELEEEQVVVLPAVDDFETPEEEAQQGDAKAVTKPETPAEDGKSEAPKSAGSS